MATDFGFGIALHGKRLPIGSSRPLFASFVAAFRLGDRIAT